MPASTFEVIAKGWEDEDILLCNIVKTCNSAELFLTIYQGNITVRSNPTSDKCLDFEINTSKTIEWYYDNYPMAKDEPEDRIPYYIFNPALGDQKYYSLLLANNHLESELIWKFSSAYLEHYSNHIICLNRNIFIDSKKMREIRNTSGYDESWYLKLGE